MHLKVYHVYPEKKDWDAWEDFIVIAANAEKARELVVNKYSFTKEQGAIFVREVDLSTEHVALSSFLRG